MKILWFEIQTLNYTISLLNNLHLSTWTNLDSYILPLFQGRLEHAYPGLRQRSQGRGLCLHPPWLGPDGHGILQEPEAPGHNRAVRRGDPQHRGEARQERVWHILELRGEKTAVLIVKMALKDENRSFYFFSFIEGINYWLFQPMTYSDTCSDKI